MNAKFLFLLFMVFIVPCSGQEATPAGESYSDSFPHLKRYTLVVPEGENFATMFARITIDKNAREEPASGPITTLSINSDGTCLAVGFQNSLMVVLDRDQHALTSFIVPGVVHSLLLDPSSEFITVACDSTLYNVGYKKSWAKRRLVPLEYSDFFGTQGDNVEPYTLGKEVPKMTPTYTFEGMGKYLVFNRAKGTLIIDPTPSSYKEWFHSYNSGGGGVLINFRGGDNTEVTSVTKGYLIAGHDDSSIHVVAHGNRMTVQGNGATDAKTISFPAVVSSLMAVRARMDQYLIGTGEGKVYHYTVGAGLPSVIDMVGKADDKEPFSALTCNANGTIAVGSVGHKLYCGLISQE